MRVMPIRAYWLLLGLAGSCSSPSPSSVPAEPNDLGGAAGATDAAPPAAGAPDNDAQAGAGPDAAGGQGGSTGGSESGGAAGAAGAAPLARCGTLEAPHAWADWLMPNPPTSSLPHPSNYTKSANGAEVTDNVTGLVWQREAPTESFVWEDAKSYCSCLTLEGDSDWRLPSRIELASLVDWTQVSPSIDSAAFPSTASDNFWTSSEVGIDPGLIYLVFFLNGHTTYAASDYEYRVRCVRGTKPSTPQRYVATTDVVQDVQTQLTWQRQIPKQLYAWSDADKYCAALALDGGSWRLPSINELQTLVDETKNPSIDLQTFPATPSEYFWSSSPVIDDATRAWTTFFTNGSTYSFAATTPRNVRCVR